MLETNRGIDPCQYSSQENNLYSCMFILRGICRRNLNPSTAGNDINKSSANTDSDRYHLPIFFWWFSNIRFPISVFTFILSRPVWCEVNIWRIVGSRRDVYMDITYFKTDFNENRWAVNHTTCHKNILE